MKKSFKSLFFYAILIVGIVFLVSNIMGTREPIDEPVLSDVVGYFKEDKVISFNVNEDMVLTLNVIGENSEAEYDESGKLLKYNKSPFFSLKEKK